MNWQPKITRKGQTEPNIWQIKGKALRLSICNDHAHYPGYWVVNCSAIGFNAKYIGMVASMTLEQAKAKAVLEASQRVRQLVEDVDDILNVTTDDINEMTTSK